MKLTIDKRYVLYYNYLAEVYGYIETHNIDESIEFWSKRFPIMYSDSFKIMIITTNKLNESNRYFGDY